MTELDELLRDSAAKTASFDDNEARDIARGNDATRLLQDTLLVESLNALEQSYINTWKQSRVNETDLREEAYRMYFAVLQFRVQLTRFISTGKLAAQTRALREAETHGAH